MYETFIEKRLFHSLLRIKFIYEMYHKNQHKQSYNEFCKSTV